MFLEILSRLKETFNHVISTVDMHLFTVAHWNQLGVL